MHSVIQPFIHSFIHPCIHSFSHSFIHSCIHFFHSFHSLSFPFLHSFVHLFIVSLIHWFIDSRIHSFIDSLVHSVSCAWILSCPWHLNHHLLLCWCTSQLHSTVVSSHLKHFPIGHHLPIVVSIFEASAPAQARHYLVNAILFPYVWAFI